MLSVKEKSIDTLKRKRTPQQHRVEEERISNNGAKSSKNYLTQVLLTSAPLIVADLLAIAGSCLLAIILQRGLNLSTELELLTSLPFLAMLFLFVYLMFGLYPGSGLSPIFELRQITVAISLVFIGLFAASLPLNSKISVFMLLSAWLFSIISAPVMRFIFRRICANCQWWGQPVLIFGDQKAGVNYDYLTSRPYFGLRPLGIVGNSGSYPFLGSFDMAPAIANKNGVFWAVVALPERSSAEIHRIVRKYIRHFPHVLFVSNLEDLPSLWNRSFDFGRFHGISIQSNLLLPFPRFVKRLVDLAIIISLGLICLPLVIIIVLLVKFSSPGPVFYGQERIGYKARHFKAWKFRTMVNNGDVLLKNYLESNPQLQEEWNKNQKLRNDPRITHIGRVLRKTSLDELPQLWNVLRGEMSMVGPRPIVEEEIVRYGESFSLYKRVVPGLTGLWQISGRNNTTYSERVDLDSYYVRNWSPWMDTYILARTIKVVLFFKGAY
jgi:Undecaprenyl-phosphate galactose phosphotransferase WbaP